MHFAIVCPKDRPEMYYDKFRQILKNEYIDIETDYYFYDDYWESPELIRGRQLKYDVIIFAGSASYEYAEGKLEKKTIWHCIPLSGTAIYKALLEAMRRGWDIKKLSFDTYDECQIIETYRELGFTEDQLSIKCINGNFKNACSNKEIFDTHREYTINQEVSGCITRLTKVGNLMEENGLPYVFASPTIGEFREQISFAKRLVLAKENAQNLFAVILVNIGLSPDYVSVNMSGLSQISERNRLAEIVYRYAHMISGSVAETGASGFMIFTTIEILKAHSDTFRECVLLDWLGKETLNLISIGVGCGKTAEEARANADISLRKCLKRNKNSCVIMVDPETIYTLGTEKNTLGERNQMLEYTNQIANETGIGIETIIKILQIVIRESNSFFTSQSLADALDISRRSADRIIERLEVSGYAASSGKAVRGRKGRPSRVVELFFEH